MPRGVKRSIEKKHSASIDTALLKPGKCDRDDVKAATEMTKEQWSALQEPDEKWPLPPYMDVKGHTHYKEETYYIVSRWTADTKIAYRPHAKSPGSKSHLRYERYGNAKTVGEALALSSYPADWCWDYERGFLKVLGGLVREVPLDLTKAEEHEVTDVDRALHTWLIRELCKKMETKQSELSKNVPWGESLLMRLLRLLAQKEAKERLEAADREGRMITEEEVLLTLKRWAFYKNPWRKNVMDEGQTWVFSDTLGLLRDRQGDLHLTTPTRRYPQVAEILTRYLTDRLPAECKNFTFSSINVNCNYAANIHRDKGNLGPSFIKAFGEFTGGELNYWPEDTGADDINLSELCKKDKVQFDLSKDLALFNGNCAHSVEQFTGSRYSLVYFTVGCHALATQEDREKMHQLGIPFPAPNTDPYNLLRAPRGYSKSAKSTPSKSDLPAFQAFDTKKMKPTKTVAAMKKQGAINIKKRLEPEDARSFYSCAQRRVRKGYTKMKPTKTVTAMKKQGAINSKKRSEPEQGVRE